MFMRFRRWMIRLLAGKLEVMLNCHVKGTVHFYGTNGQWLVEKNAFEHYGAADAWPDYPAALTIGDKV